MIISSTLQMRKHAQRGKVTQLVKGAARFTSGAVDKGLSAAFAYSCSLLGIGNLPLGANPGKRKSSAGREGQGIITLLSSTHTESW